MQIKVGILSRKNTWAIAVLSAALLLIYSPALLIPFGMSDDYYHLAGYLKAGNTLEFLSFGPTQGRILQGILLYKFFQPAQISDFSIYRGVLLAGYILTGFMLFAVLRRHEPTVMSLLVSLCCLALLPFQAWLAWSMLLFVPYAALLGGLAGWISHIGIASQKSGRKIGTWAVAVFIYWVALNIYQPAAMFYWVISAFILLSDNPGFFKLAKRTAIVIIIGVLGMFASYLTTITAQTLSGLSDIRTGLVVDILGKLKWFVSDPLISSLNFYLLKPSIGVAVLVGIVIIAGLLVYLRGNLPGKIASLLIFAGFAIFSYSPNLVIAKSWGSYRSQASLSVLLFLYTFMALKSLVVRLLSGLGTLDQRSTSLMTWGAGAFTLGVLVLAQYRYVQYFAMPGFIEQRYLKSELIQGLNEDTQKIVVIRANWEDSISGFVRYDEFGLPSSYPEYGANPMVIATLAEIDPRLIDLPVQGSSVRPKLRNRSKELLIDMRKIKDFRN